MNRKLEETIRKCTEPLRGDWTLEHEVAQELRTHLEEKCAELERDGISSEKSVNDALKSFGSPEEIGDQLFRANFTRLHRLAKLRWLGRILLIPLLFSALLATVNFDVIGGWKRILSLQEDWSPIPEFLFSIADWWNTPPPLTEEDRLFCGTGSPESEAAMRRELSDRHPEDPLFLAHCMLAVCRTASPRAEEFDAGIRREPENALYRYLKVAVLLREALPELPFPKHSPTPAEGMPASVKDRRKLEAAIKEYLAALRCPRNTDYALERRNRSSRILYRNRNFCDAVGRKVDDFSFPLPHLQVYRQLGRMIPRLAGVLIREGRMQEAETVLDSWERFTQHLLQDCETVIGVLVIHSILEDWRREFPALYTKVGNAEKGRRAASRIAETGKEVREWRKQVADQSASSRSLRKSFQRRLREEGGLFSIVSAWNPLEKPDPLQLAAERRITYQLCDQLMLLCFGWIGVGISVLLCVLLVAGWLFGCRGHQVRFSGGQYARLFLYGVLVPVLLYWCFSRIELLSGRNLSLFSNWLYWVQCAWFLLVLPGWFVICCRRFLARRAVELLPWQESGKRPSFSGMTVLATLLPLWIGFLLFTGGTARLVMDLELRRSISENQIFFSGFPTVAEERWWRSMSSGMRKVLESGSGGEVREKTPPAGTLPRTTGERSVPNTLHSDRDLPARSVSA